MNTRNRRPDRPDGARHAARRTLDPLRESTARAISARLIEALGLARSALPDALPRLRGILHDALCRADAWLLTVDRERGRDATEPEAALPRGGSVRHVTVAASAAIGPEPLTEWLLIPFGEIDVDRPLSGRSFVFTPRHAEAAKAWFDGLGRKLAIDYEHQSFDSHNTRPDGLRPAAGWIGALEVRDDGLWVADVSWTDRAAELLRSGEYRYFSPVIYWSDEDCTDLAALGPVALTNDPAMRGVRALAAARRVASDDADAARRPEPPTPDPDDSVDPDADESAETDGDVDDAPAVIRLAASRDDVGEDALEDEEEVVPRRLLDELHVEVSTLRRQLAAQAADAFVERGMRLGKILDSTSMDWRDDYLRDALEAERRLERSPVLRPPGRVIRVDARGTPEDSAALLRRRGRDDDLLRRSGIEPEDLQAFERAAACGRVRYAAPHR